MPSKKDTKINGVSYGFSSVQTGTIVMKGCNQSFVWWYTHLIPDSVLDVHITLVPIYNLEKIKVFSCHRVSFSDRFFCVPALTLTCFRYIFCNHFVFENATNIVFLLCYWKNKNKKQFLLCYWIYFILLKLVYRVDRAASQQSTARKGLWRNEHRIVVEGAKSMHHSTVLCNSGLPPKTCIFMHEDLRFILQTFILCT